jgi:hypothetical protein
VSVSTRTVAGVSFRPQISAHTGTNTSINTTAATRAGTAIDLTCPCSRRTAPPSGESRRSMRDESDTHRARNLSFLASSSKRSSSGCPWTRVPRCREPLGGGQSVGEVVTGRVGESATVHPSPYTCSRIAGTHAVRTRQTSHSIALRDVENPATLHVRCGSSSPLLRSRPSDRSSVYGGTGAR